MGPGGQAQHIDAGDEQEHYDRGHLDRCEPELELAEGLDRHQVGQRQHHQQHQADDPVGHVGQPVAHQVGTGHGFQRHHDDPEIPVHPAGQEAGQVAHCRSVAPGFACILIETAAAGHGAGHLAQHAHHQHHQEPGDQEGKDRGRAGGLDDDAAADKEACADHATERDHGHVALLEAVG
ncbi:hypothetical protein D9M72_532420 [compost metagenome]